MSKKEELHKKIWNIWMILITATECYQYLSYLYNPDTEEELNYLNQSEDFSIFKRILYRTTVTELAKLFRESRSDKFNVFHFIDTLKEGGYYADMGIESSKISDWEMHLSANDKSIKQVLILRDNVYAHTESKVIHDGVTLKELGKLIEVTEIVIREIYGTVLHATLDMEVPTFNKIRFGALTKTLARAGIESRERIIKEFHENRTKRLL